MEIKNNRTIYKATTILTSDLNLIENFASDTHPYCIWVDKEQAEQPSDLRTFLLEHQEEYNLLKSGDIDYIVVEYDM